MTTLDTMVRDLREQEIAAMQRGDFHAALELQAQMAALEEADDSVAIDGLEEELSDVKGERDELEDEKSDLKEESRGLREEVSALRGQLAQAQTECESLKAQLQLLTAA